VKSRKYGGCGQVPSGSLAPLSGESLGHLEQAAMQFLYTLADAPAKVHLQLLDAMPLPPPL
jgi:hypothetical protein